MGLCNAGCVIIHIIQRYGNTICENIWIRLFGVKALNSLFFIPQLFLASNSWWDEGPVPLTQKLLEIPKKLGGIVKVQPRKRMLGGF